MFRNALSVVGLPPDPKFDPFPKNAPTRPEFVDPYEFPLEIVHLPYQSEVKMVYGGVVGCSRTGQVIRARVQPETVGYCLPLASCATRVMPRPLSAALGTTVCTHQYDSPPRLPRKPLVTCGGPVSTAMHAAIAVCQWHCPVAYEGRDSVWEPVAEVPASAESRFEQSVASQEWRLLPSNCGFLYIQWPMNIDSEKRESYACLHQCTRDIPSLYRDVYSRVMRQ